ncbi:cytochrome c [Hymenobacter sp. BT730]|uniref:cytochrome c n=1 Tax=Hymenobacter sp. BT730 TaxID=3063332 RepID=UPI0026DF9C6B|nr:c-type cytochrome [Hymenobacter sp. BT730]
MKKIFKILGGLLALVAVAILGFVVWVQARGIPTYDPPKMAVQPVAITPARVLQGEKIVTAMCADCHLDRSTNALTGKFMNDLPPEFGKIYAANITQDKTHGIGSWTDAELVGLFRTGIGRDGRFRMVMPNFVHMSDEDVNSVIAFLRSNNALVKAQPIPSHEQEPSFLGKMLVNTVMKPTPVPAKPVLDPDTTDGVAYGHYLVVGRYKCYECHSKDFKTNNALVPEKSEGYLAGGTRLLTPTGQEILSRNITCDEETGIGDWTEAQFVQAVRFGQGPNGPLKLPMPKFTLMSPQEARAIYAYLHTVPKLKNATAEDGGGTVATR